MRFVRFPLGFLFAVSITTSAFAADILAETLQKTFPATAGGKLVVDADRGSITVTGGTGNEVSVEVIRKVTRGSQKKAAELLERHEVTMTQDGDTIRVETDLRGNDGWNFRGPNLEVSIRVSVPREFQLNANTAGGSVRVTGLKGDVSARTAGGSLHFADLEGKLLGRTSGGSIRGSHINGPVDVVTSGGSVEMEVVSGGPLKAGTSGGSIRMAGISAPAEVRTSGGSIRMESSGTPLTASSSGGSVDVVMTSVPVGSVDLKSSGGGLSLALPDASSFQLDASTSAGGVRSEFPVQSSQSGDRGSLKGPVNGGGPLMKLRTSAGSIRIRKS